MFIIEIICLGKNICECLNLYYLTIWHFNFIKIIFMALLTKCFCALLYPRRDVVFLIHFLCIELVFDIHGKIYHIISMLIITYKADIVIIEDIYLSYFINSFQSICNNWFVFDEKIESIV